MQSTDPDFTRFEMSSDVPALSLTVVDGENACPVEIVNYTDSPLRLC